MRRNVLTLSVCVLLACSAREATAQIRQVLERPWTDRGYATLNVGFEGGSETLNDQKTFRGPLEEGTIAVQSEVDSGALIDLAVGSRVWRNVSVGIGFHRGSTSGDAALQAAVPHPLGFDRHRRVDLAVTDLRRTERAVHLLFGYMVPLNDPFSVHVTIGPSFFNVRQQVISDATFAEVGPPFTSVTTTPIVVQRSDSTVGFNFGVDTMYKLYEVDLIKVGVGAFLRYTGASAKIQILESVVDTDVGGPQFGFGARLRF